MSNDTPSSAATVLGTGVPTPAKAGHSGLSHYPAFSTFDLSSIYAMAESQHLLDVLQCFTKYIPYCRNLVIYLELFKHLSSSACANHLTSVSIICKLNNAFC